jgi:hypothetical protein
MAPAHSFIYPLDIALEEQTVEVTHAQGACPHRHLRVTHSPIESRMVKPSIVQQVATRPSPRSRPTAGMGTDAQKHVLYLLLLNALSDA